MTDVKSKAELLARIENGWTKLISYVDSLTPEQRETLTDPAGWTVKDHAIHLSAWESSQVAALDGKNRAEAMGVPAELWGNWDAINDAIQKRHRDRTWEDIRQAMHESRRRLVARIEALSSEEILLPYKHYQPSSPWDVSVLEWLSGNTWDHFQEHQDYMEAIVRGDEDESPPTVAELLRRIDVGWDKLWAYLNSLTPEQLTQKTDAAGWTVKDHVIHMAMWEYGMVALLDGTSRLEAMGVGDTDWDMDMDARNAVIQQRNKDLPLEEVYAIFRDRHVQTRARIAALADEDLQRPYRYFQPDSDRDKPVLLWLVGDTYGHYAEHLPWIRAIAES